MIKIPYHPRYIVDTCVMRAHFDEGEPYHADALDFFQQLDAFARTGRPVEQIIPAHLYLEFNLGVARTKEDVARGINKTYKFRQPQEGVSQRTPYPITAFLMKKIEDEGLYEKFGTKLRLGDFIYAAIAYFEKVPLVTLDKDFSKINSEINVINLLPKSSP